MILYFSPLACSMATRVSLYEAGADATYVEVDGKTKLTREGADFRAVNPLGLVPALATDDGDFITENAAILQYIANRFPHAGLAPVGGMEQTRLHQWLSFIGTEVHKGVFTPLLDATAPDGAKAYALEKAPARLAFLEARLADREFLLDRFSVGDAYLVTVLGWSVVTPLDLARWPGLKVYVTRLRARPSIAKAFQEERELYFAEQKRNETRADICPA